VVDLSADFRLYDVEVYKKWYGEEHKAPQLQKEAVYAITEVRGHFGYLSGVCLCVGSFMFNPVSFPRASMGDELDPTPLTTPFRLSVRPCDGEVL
jgi:hypothetical protein